MAFKLGKRSTRPNTPMDKPMVFQKKMEDGSIAQANMDGTIDVDPSVNMNSRFGRRVLRHEQTHIEQMEESRAAYGDNWVMWNDNIYFRKEEDGIPVIDGPNGRWPEGDEHHPWEAEAIAAEKNNNKE